MKSSKLSESKTKNSGEKRKLKPGSSIKERRWVGSGIQRRWKTLQVPNIYIYIDTHRSTTHSIEMKKKNNRRGRGKFRQKSKRIQRTQMQKVLKKCQRAYKDAIVVGVVDEVG